MSESKYKVTPFSTIRKEKLKLTAPKKYAAGLPALLSSLKQMKAYMNIGQAVKLSLAINQKGGFDCPGCAWPDPDDDRSIIGEYCENGVKAIAEEATKKSIGAAFFKENSVKALSDMSDFELGKLGRITEPVILREGHSHYESIAWEDAFNFIASELIKYSPDEALFYTSGRTSNEAAFLYQLMVRCHGTNNLPDCSNMCHESSGVGLMQTLGIGKGSVTLQDFSKAEVIMVIGQNPGTNHPRMLSALEKCKANGGKIISINPLPEAGMIRFVNPQSPLKILSGGTTLTDHFLQVKINGDVALLKAIMILLLEKERKTPGSVFDQEFIHSYTLGYDALITELDQTNLQSCIDQSGVDKKRIDEVVELLANKKKIIICWAMGLTQHINAVDNIREIVNLLLLKGSIGIEGGGTCPVRGHSNVQGDRTMGIWEAPHEKFLSKLDEVFNIKSPRHHGLAVVPAIHAMHQNKAHVFIALGGNFIAATPDTNYTAEALVKTSLSVQISTKLNRSHLVCGKTAIILPCLGRTDIDTQDGKEQFVTCENSMGVVHTSRGQINPVSNHMKSEVSIICDLAQKLFPHHHIPWSDYANNYNLIRDDIAKVIPGFENFNTKVAQPEGFYLPNGPREKTFTTASGKAHFTVTDLTTIDVEDDELVMMTIRSHDQFNTTIYGLDDRYRGIANGRRVVLMNAYDMEVRNLLMGEYVDLSSTHSDRVRFAHQFQIVPYSIPRGNVATYFPESNPLVPVESYAKESGTPASKYVKIKVHKILTDVL